MQHKRKRISYSELKLWNDCAFKHKLVYLDKIKGFVGNEYTAFGSACHAVNEKLILDENILLIKYKDFTSRGDLSLLKKKEKTSFYNQLTILFNYY